MDTCKIQEDGEEETKTFQGVQNEGDGGHVTTDEAQDDEGEEVGGEIENTVKFWESSQVQNLKEDNESKNKLAVLWKGTQHRDQSQQQLDKTLDQTKCAVSVTCRTLLMLYSSFKA